MKDHFEYSFACFQKKYSKCFLHGMMKTIYRLFWILQSMFFQCYPVKYPKYFSNPLAKNIDCNIQSNNFKTILNLGSINHALLRKHICEAWSFQNVLQNVILIFCELWFRIHFQCFLLEHYDFLGTFWKSFWKPSGCFGEKYFE